MKKISIFIVLLLSFTGIFAQQPEEVREDWLAKDVENLEAIPGIWPVENHSLNDLQRVLNSKTRRGYSMSNDSNNFGFGFKRFSIGVPGGYCHLRVSGMAFNDKYANYQLSVDCSSTSWKNIRQRIIEVWKLNGGPDFKESENGISTSKKFDGVFEEYKRSVSSQLGEMHPIDVPANLKNEYGFLVSPTVNSTVSNGECSYGGVMPKGKEAIDLFIKAKRVDLLENILRGYNPGGRIYAILALNKLRAEGTKWSPGTAATIEKVINLDIPIDNCQGCIFYSNSAKEVIQKYKF